MFWRWKLLFLVFLLGAPAIAYALVSREHPVYQSSLLLQEGALPVDTSLFTSGGAPEPATTPTPQTLAGQARVIETPAVSKLAARHLSPPPSHPGALYHDITATGDGNTGFITITAHASTPEGAAQIANAFGKAVVTLRTQQANGLLGTAIDQLSAELAQMRPGNVGRAQLSGQIQRLRALRASQGDDAQILQWALPSSTPVAPRKTRTVGLGAVLGLLLGIGAVFLANGADRRIRHPEDLEEITGLPLLGVIPNLPRGAIAERSAGGRLDEAFHMLRSTLMFFDVDRPLSTILIASPFKGDGKTTVATRLALAAAQSGQNVILIDADLRRPQTPSRLGIRREAIELVRGLAGVLSGQCALADTLIEVPISRVDRANVAVRELSGRLRLLPAGRTPPNPSELLASARMSSLMSEVAEFGDLVIIDTNPLLSVSDALPLVRSASGVVLVARLHSTTRDAVRRFHTTVTNTGGKMLGVVANGAKGGMYGRYGYGSGYGYTSNGNGAYANGDGTGRFRVIARRSQRSKEKQPK